MSKVTCQICPYSCQLSNGQVGFCNARICRDGQVCAANYGIITSMALDPIEKKPLNRFYPDSNILSVGSYGCNLRCGFCQNHEISMANSTVRGTVNLAPRDLVNKALSLADRGNIGIAFTYNEPLIGYEYVYDTAKLARQQRLQTVLVTNGTVCKQPLLELLPYVSAMNIDLKAFTPEFYREICGDLETVKQTIALAAQHCHIEVTTLIIPGRNDSPEELRKLSQWLAEINKDIPLHVSRFFPHYHSNDVAATPVNTIYSLADVARRSLRYVYEGNC